MPTDSPARLPRPLLYLLQGIVIVLIPVLLVLLSVRLVMSETWLRFEYQRAGFPADLYGWDSETRLNYGPYGIRYLLEGRDIRYLGDLEIDGQQAFTADELRHMEDVQQVTQVAFRVLNLSLLIFAVAALPLAIPRRTRPLLLRATAYGGALLLLLSGSLLLVALLSWDFFFDSFHALFFEEGSWQFHNSDTLIRLYPQQFWFDSALLVGGLSLGGALLLVLLPGGWFRRQQRAKLVLAGEEGPD